MMAEQENWTALVTAARRAGWRVDDDGATVEFKLGKADFLYVKNRQRRGQSSYETAREDLQIYGVKVSDEK